MNTEKQSAMSRASELVSNAVRENLNTIDREARFDEMLDERYSFDSIGGPFACMSPSQVLKDCDPTAYRCGVNDWADGEDFAEVDGDTYDRKEVQEEIDTLVSEIEDEIADLESEEDSDHSTEIARLSSIVEALNSYL